MESPQKKPAFGNAFGSSSADNSTNSAGFRFGQPAQQPSNGLFGFGGNQNANDAGNANGGGLFGRVSKLEGSPTPASPFGQPTSQPPSSFTGFGQAVPAQQPQKPTFSFGQSSNTSTPSTTAPAFGLDQSTSVSQNFLPAFRTQTEAPKFTFGKTSTTLSEPHVNSFAAPATQSGSNIFGSGNTSGSQAPSMGFDSSTTTTAAPFSFGQPTTNASTPSNPLGGFGASKTGETQSATPLFGSYANTPQPAAENQEANASPDKSAAPSSQSKTQPATNPFAGLFSPTSNTSQAPGISFGTTTQPTVSTAENSGPKPPTPAFSFGTANQPTAPTTDTAEPKPSTPAFSFGRTSPVPASATEPVASASKPSFSFGMTAQAPRSEPKSSETQPSNPFSFGAKPARSEKPANAQHIATSASTPEKTQEGDTPSKDASSTPAKSSFNFPAQPQPISSGGLFSPARSTTESSVPSGGLFNKPSRATEAPARPLFGALKPASTENESQQPAGDVFPPGPKMTPASSTGSVEAALKPPPPSPPPSSTPSFGGFPRSDLQKTQTSPTAIPVTTDESTKFPAEPLKRPVFTNAPSHIPPRTDAEQFQEFDRSFRLHSLNLGLQKKLSTLDPRTQDFDNIVRHYAAARESIGASLGLYVRTVAGTKRKGDQVDDRDEESEPNKRARSENIKQSFPPKHRSTSTSFGTDSTPQQSIFKAPSDTAMNDVGPSKTTRLLNDMIPQSSTTSMANPFANLAQETENSGSAPSTTPTKSPPKKPTFELPKFGGGSTNFLSAFSQKAKENADKFEKSLIEKRKAEDFDSDEDDEETFRRQTEEELRAKRAKIDAIAKGGFTPTFGASSSVPKESTKPTFTGFTPAAPRSNPFSAPESTEASGEQSEDANEDEDDHEHGGSSNDQADEADEDGDDEDEAEDDLPEDEVIEEDAEDDDDDDDDDDNDLQAAMDRAKHNPNAGKSLFDRIEPGPHQDKATSTNGDKKDSGSDSNPIMQSAKNSSFPPSLWGSHIGKSTPEAPSFSPITPATTGATKSPYKPATTFNFTPTPPTTTTTSAPGASIFAGGLTRDGPVPGEGMFGSRPSTPSNAEKPTNNLAKSILNSPPGTDNTWKEGAPISFANGDKTPAGPTFKFTAPSPGEDASTPRPFGSLFGTPSGEPKGSETPNQLGFQFGAPTSAPAPGYLGAISHLGGGSVASSNASSRATSPGLTDNESVATNDTEDSTNDPQTSLMDSRAGEENETCLWEGRSKALMFITKEAAQGTKMTPNDWNSKGVGQLRVLKDRTSGKTRVVFRVEPSASVLINSHLVESVTYESVPSTKSGAVKGALFYNGSLNRWVFKVKSPDMAGELAKIMEDNKGA